VVLPAVTPSLTAEDLLVLHGDCAVETLPASVDIFTTESPQAAQAWAETHIPLGTITAVTVSVFSTTTDTLITIGPDYLTRELPKVVAARCRSQRPAAETGRETVYKEFGETVKVAGAVTMQKKLEDGSSSGDGMGIATGRSV
jgi:hypothetical protein